MATKKRRTARVEARREVLALAATLGGQIRSERRRRGLTQTELGMRIGIGTSHVSRIERGFGARVPLDVWIALGLALERPIAVAMSRPLDGREPSDAGHLALQEIAIEFARRHGWRTSFELPTRPADPSRSVDVAVRDDQHRRLHIWECWSRFGDLGEAARSTNRKIGEAEAIAATLVRGPYSVHSCWLVRPTAANRELVRRYPGIIRSRFPGSSLAWAQAIEHAGPPPSEPGIVWCDPGTGRIVPIRLRG